MFVSWQPIKYLIKMKLYALRHTSLNIDSGICYGISDVDVASTFPQEVDTVKSKLGTQKFDRVYSSPLQRCAKLARSLAPRQDIVFDERIREMDFGDWENLLWDDIALLPGATEFFNDFVNTVCPNGESFARMIERVSVFLNEVQTLPLKNVLVVTHGAPSGPCVL
jgi:alpha-ribazole phosphatase